MKLLRNMILALIGIPAALLELIAVVAKIPEKLTELIAAINALVKAWTNTPGQEINETTRRKRRKRMSKGTFEDLPEWAAAKKALHEGDRLYLTKLSVESCRRMGVRYPCRTFCEGLRRYVKANKLSYNVGYVGGVEHGEIRAQKIETRD